MRQRYWIYRGQLFVGAAVLGRGTACQLICRGYHVVPVSGGEEELLPLLYVCRVCCEFMHHQSWCVWSGQVKREHSRETS